MLFSQLIITLSRQVFLPAVTLYLLLIYGGILSENGALHQAAAMGKWGINTFFKVLAFVYAFWDFLTCFMERLMRWRFSSTFNTTTFTISPTLTASLGWRRRRFAT